MVLRSLRGCCWQKDSGPRKSGTEEAKEARLSFPLCHVPAKLVYRFQQEISSPGSKHDHPVSSWGRYFEGRAQAGGSRSQGAGLGRLHPASALAALSVSLFSAKRTLAARD